MNPCNIPDPARKATGPEAELVDEPIITLYNVTFEIYCGYCGAVQVNPETGSTLWRTYLTAAAKSDTIYCHECRSTIPLPQNIKATLEYSF